jgi:hypothetical protein
MSLRRGAVRSLALMAVVGLGACGGGKAVAVKPAAVPDGLVPASVQGGAYAFYPSDLPQVKDAFANAGANSLVADGKLWELRRDDRLVGILQLSTLLPELDLLKAEHRDQVIDQMLPTARDEILVGDVQVFTSVANQKTVYLWFGDHLFNLLTVKPGSGDDLDPEQVLTEVLDHESQSPAWKPVYFDDEDDEDV